MISRRWIQRYGLNFIKVTTTWPFVVFITPNVKIQIMLLCPDTQPVRSIKEQDSRAISSWYLGQKLSRFQLYGRKILRRQNIYLRRS